MGTGGVRKSHPELSRCCRDIVHSDCSFPGRFVSSSCLRIQCSFFYVIIESGKSGVKNGVGKRRESKKRLNANVRGAKSGRRTWVTLFGFRAESKLRENRASATSRTCGRSRPPEEKRSRTTWLRRG